MVTLCQKCGDPGFAVALIYCEKCQEVAEHRYCLNVIPKTFTEYVTWFCEDCNPKDSRKDEARVRYLSSKTCRYSSKSGNKKKVSKSALTSRMKSTTTKYVAVSALGDESSHSAQPLDVHGSRNCEADQTQHDGAMDIDDLERTKCNVVSYNNFHRDLAKQNTYSNILMTSSSELLNQNGWVPSQPIFEPVWRGCFTLCVGEFGTVDGLAAHLSTKASLQVFEEARLLPASLCPELHPRLNIWPKGFIKSGPKDENIGLYFFPQNKSDENQYDILVNHMVECDLAMRAEGACADLLIFTSTELPLNNWRFQAKYYLWGVFRGKEASLSRARGPGIDLQHP
ncbi:unnamed protein product [Rhodiola kirilowii]